MDAKVGNKSVGALYENLTAKERRMILLAVAVGTFMGPLDGSVVNIALPSISAFYNVSLATVEWVVMSYLLIISSLLLTYGRMGDLYGHKRIYISGFAVFSIGSLLCALSPSIMLLIIFRAVQAIGAGMMMSMGPAIITNITPPQQRGKSLGLIAIAVSVALTTGPILGGFLTSHFGWQSVFYINIPIGIISIIFAYKVIPDVRNHNSQPFDVIGSLLLFFALICILFPLSYGEKIGWLNPTIIGLLSLGLVLLLVFVLFEKRIPYPMLDLSLFRNRLYSMGNLSAMINYMAMYSVILIMPFYFQQLLQLSPAQAGMMLIPMPLVTMIVAPISGTISDKLDSRYISSLGMGITAFGLWLLSNLDINSSKFYIEMSLAVIGLGTGMFQTPNNSAVLGSVPPNRRGIASSMLAIMRNIGMVLGVAIAGAVYSSRIIHLTEGYSGQGLEGIALKAQSFTGAVQMTFLVAACIALIAVFTSLVRGSLKSQTS
ncbi:MAG: multidrug MFS transporter [Clostridiaceae bacterium BRH_c20a]|nr:MAG: multidrug MFS transporter [Clostridiaceae bacterium BRH_c20a]